MNWYKILKLSALESNWYEKAYEHFIKTMSFIFSNKNCETEPCLIKDKIASGIERTGEGFYHFFSFRIKKGQNEYHCGIRLEYISFANSKPLWGALGTGTLMGVNTTPDNLYRVLWYCIKNFENKDNADLVGKGYISGANMTPYNILNQIKEAIQNDIDDDGSSHDEPDYPIDDPDPIDGDKQPVYIRR